MIIVRKKIKAKIFIYSNKRKKICHCSLKNRYLSIDLKNKEKKLLETPKIKERS